ncbi:MAG: 16S rRNA (adenine(1518)-N(6)/adenine(1519)-N(6))-dimethyltransferase RsmA [Acidobacteriota bacterium]
MLARAKKSLGQHFLVDSVWIQRILGAAREASTSATALLEIGPGGGALTSGLLDLHLPTWAVEVDRELAAALARERPDLRVVLGDARELDLPKLAGSGARWLVVGNLPYNAGTEILRRILSRPGEVASAVVMLQREVAWKFCASAGGEGYGPLAVWTDGWWKRRLLFSVPPGAFRPCPKVISAVCRFDPKERASLPPNEQERFWSFLRMAFASPRKAMGAVGRSLGYAVESWPAILERVEVDRLARPNQVEPAVWTRLFELRGLR